MKEKSTEIFARQIEKIDLPDFDLESWKMQTIVLIERIFGERSSLSEQVRNLHSDYSSWTLRDTRGKSSPIENAKQRARDILSAAMIELDQMNYQGEEEQSPVLDAIRESLEEHLKMSAYRKIVGIVQADIPTEQKEEEIRDLLRDSDADLAHDFFVSLFSNSKLKAKLS